ncbi:hypothetical protein DL96DRAFT_1467778 [Flagelloscypha sp. PMI_526]|nr:hypothetical protein DL96DRAFT_1467778 [Flagelloscypha sp. PMI_526]
MTSLKETILLVGATGYAGRKVAKALVDSQNFNVHALVRSASLTKPLVEELRDSGVTIHPGDIATDGSEQLENVLKGVDIFISMVLPVVDQRPLILAAKKAGVKRFVPSEFGPHAPPGATIGQDMKNEIREFIKDHSVPFTFIEVGWWSLNILPLPHVNPGAPLPEFGKQFAGSGKVLVSWTEWDSVGKLVTLIVADPRTLNQTVHAYDGEATLEEGWDLGTKISGEDFSDYPKASPLLVHVTSHLLTVLSFQITLGQVEERMSLSFLHRVVYGLYKSILFDGDNTVEKAVAAGALDSHRLYPDYKPPTLEESAKVFYQAPPSITYDI